MSARGPAPRIIRFLLAAGAALLTISAPSQARLAPRLAGRWPHLMLWAWERPEDLRALPPGAGVAFLAQTITVTGAAPGLAPRHQPLRVDPATPLVAVTRIEVPAGANRLPTDADAAAIAGLIARTRSLPQVVGLQIDFDATLSQRPFYRQLMRELRTSVGQETPISVTALASWCAGDRWLDSLGADEAVPMLFRMGPTNESFRGLGLSGGWRAPACRAAVGTSLDEPTALHADGRRLYVFAPRAWTAASIRQAAVMAR